MSRHTLAAVLTTGLSALLLAQVGGEETAAPRASISPSDLRRDVAHLASDEMRGRLVGTPENERAAAYIEDRYREHGLRPPGPSGSYRQPFLLATASRGDDNRLVVTTGGAEDAATLDDDFFPMPFSPTARADGHAVFVGFGISATDPVHADYADVDVTGAIVLVLDHEPGEYDPASPFAGIVPSEHGRAIRKALEAQRQGAVGIMFVEDVHNHRARPTLRDLAHRVWPRTAPRVPAYQLARWAQEVQIPAVRISAALADRLLRTSGQTLRQRAASAETAGGVTPLPLPGVTLEIATAVTRHQTSVDNVVGLIEGVDPALRHEWVILCAHYDHEGATPTRIYNGADDDASGVAALLEIAEAYALAARAGTRPARSILLAAWNAEEQGLLGAWAYTRNPLTPLRSTVAVINMDMIGRSEEVPAGGGYRFTGLPPQTAASNRNAVNVLGYSYSRDLRDAVEEANEQEGLELRFRYDNNRSNLIRRSDHWPFLFHRVPAIFVHTGLHPDYHTERDRPDTLDYDKMARIVRMVYDLSWSLAGHRARPRLD